MTDQGQEFLEHSLAEVPLVESVVRDMKEQSSRFLELVATMLYFDHLPKEEVEQKVLEVKKKSNYTTEDMEEAWNFIGKITH